MRTARLDGDELTIQFEPSETVNLAEVEQIRVALGCSQSARVFAIDGTTFAQMCLTHARLRPGDIGIILHHHDIELPNDDSAGSPFI